ncbi:VOC family protein [Nocardia asteroides]|uniref:VOC family protein n=1 Tax=Nocardia asteroides TaxID=1824 RepID=UPI0036476BE3
MHGRRDAHAGVHSELGALPGEHPGRHQNPVIKVLDLAWLEFEKPDLERAETFAHAFGFRTAYRDQHELQLRGAHTGAPCVRIRRGGTSRFTGLAFHAADPADLERLATALDTRPFPLSESLGGRAVVTTDPSGLRVRVVAETHPLDPLPTPAPLDWNRGDEATRINRPQRPPREPSPIQRLGHVVVQTTRFRQTLDWYLRYLGLIVSDFLYYAGQRHRGPVMSFIRCDRGPVPTDHHTLALTLGPSNRYVHSAFQVPDLDTLAAGGAYLHDHGYRHSWGIGRHVQGSQIFDYWRDPDGFLVEHFSDGDLFDNTEAPGWAPMTASGLAQWGPPATADFLGVAPGRHAAAELGAIFGALRDENNEFDLRRLAGLMKVARS